MPRLKRKWHRADIKAALQKRQSSLAQLARQHGFQRQTMSWALMKPHLRANAAISACLNIPMSELWPDWYGADGKRLRSPKSSRKSASRAIPVTAGKVPRNSQQTASQESSPPTPAVARAAA